MTASSSLRHSKTVSAPVEPTPLFVSFLEQAEVCREQARDAARLKRYRAALGLFSTAAALCKHARSMDSCDECTRELARERLEQIDMEAATYVELARAMERPVSSIKVA